MSSILEQSLERKIIKVQQELIKLKTRQNYNPSQINYSIQSNVLSGNAYLQYSGSSHYGYIGEYVYTSSLKNIVPRVNIEYSGVNGRPLLLDARVENENDHAVKIILRFVDSLSTTGFNFNFNVWVDSNVQGVLELRKTYEFLQ